MPQIQWLFRQLVPFVRLIAEGVLLSGMVYQLLAGGTWSTLDICVVIITFIDVMEGVASRVEEWNTWHKTR